MAGEPTSAAELDRLVSEPTSGTLEAIHACDGDFAVLGAGGRLGYPVCQMIRRALGMLGRTNEVHAVSRFRDATTRERFDRTGFSVISANLGTPTGLSRCPEVENVFYLAGPGDEATSSPELLHRINVAMPRMVADHFRHSRIIALSSGQVYRATSPESNGSDEHDAADPKNETARSMLGRELSFRESSEQHGSRCALVRMDHPQELRHGILADVARTVLAGEPVDLSRGYVKPIWEGDAIAQMIQSLPRASSPPFVVNVTGDEAVSIRWIAETFAESFGTDLHTVGEEPSTARLGNPARAREVLDPPWVKLDWLMEWVAAWAEREAG